jgi:diguanylate cyclase (GGDEF)-like protein/PAS domain S-box-containing protein
MGGIGMVGFCNTAAVVIGTLGVIAVALIIFIWLRSLKQNKEARSQSQVTQIPNKHFEQSIIQAPVPMVITDPHGDIRLFNNKFIEIFGYTLDDVSTADAWWSTAYPDKEYREEVKQAWVEAIQNAQSNGGEIEPQEWNLRAKNGQTRRVEFKMTVLDEISLIAMNDITQCKQIEKELRMLSRAVELGSSAVIITNVNGDIEYVNPKFTDITGYAKSEVLGKNPRLLKSGELPEPVYAKLWNIIQSGKEWKGKFHNRKKNGELYWAHDSISSVRDETGQITHFIAIQNDITQEHELSEQLTYQDTHDLLTGLVNRKEFERKTEHVLLASAQEKKEHALCFLDLDQFKVINDTSGHVAGDELLRQLGQRLESVVRKRDTLARLGGDEFGILMEYCSQEQATRVANEILKSIQGFQFSWLDQTYRISVSIGLVAITESIPNMTELLKQADAACYMAKELGRNRIHVYRPEDIDLAQRQGEMQWVTRINHAIENDLFCLYAQPIVPLNNSGNKHYELLIRMIDENGTIIPPGAFLPAAERFNFIETLDAWVVKHAFTLLSQYPEFMDEIEFVSINLSGPSLTNGNFLEYISTQFRKTGIEARKICFEITETVAISNFNAAISFISVLRSFGCRFALDDFGSGLSSFGYLKNLPVDYLKIDGVFVKGIVNDPIDRAMVKSINDIGHVIGMQTVAEFVENDEIVDILKDIGVDFGQGYGLGKPGSLNDLLEQHKN